MIRTEIDTRVKTQNWLINISMKLFAKSQPNCLTSKSELFQHFQLFIIKETNTNIFHYMKFLKAKANQKQKKGILEALYYIKDY